MIYTVIANGQSYDLPTKTLGIMERLDEALQIDSKPLTIKQKYQKLLDFVKTILGEENTAEVLGSDKVTDIDVGELELLILKIQDAYNQPAADYRTERLESSLDAIPSDKIISVTNAAKAVIEAEKLKK